MVTYYIGPTVGAAVDRRSPRKWHETGGGGEGNANREKRGIG